MAAYAALVSVMHIIETIQNHPRPPISFDEEQLQSLTEKITFLQEFLETHSIDDDDLEGRIADAAYKAEDVIESHIVHKTRNFYDGLRKVIQDLDMIQRDVTSFAKKTRIKDDDDQLLHTNYTLRRPADSYSGQDQAEGLDDVIVEVMNKLTWNQSSRRIIPIVGMGGIGKTTLARNIYVNPVIEQYFDFRGWATISQEYNSKEILSEILLCLNMGSREILRQMSEDELGVKLHKSLFGRKYLIVLDDIWSIEAWDRVKTFFPNENDSDGSAIILTTRLSNLASQLSDSHHDMSFLDNVKSWNLFCKTTFGEERCPVELEGIGRKIVENCKGLPLSIIVVGGLLAKSKRTQEYWLYIAENLNSILSSENDKRCIKILLLSYEELPVHLKPCFLYMGVFREDSVIDVPELMRLWVAEGFLKPIRGECLEVVAIEYFNDLLARNLVLAHKRGYSGETIKCKVHDLLLDVCAKEAKKHKFLCVARHRDFSNPRRLSNQRRIAVHDGTDPTVIHDWLSHHGTLVRSLTVKYSTPYEKPFNSRLLRVWNLINDLYILKSSHKMVNCRYISGAFIMPPYPSRLSSISRLIFGRRIPSSCTALPSPIFSLWNLQTLRVRHWEAQVPTSEIWKMPQLRHVCLYELNLLDPRPTSDGGDDFVLRNLQTLSNVRNFKFSGDVIRRIPNIKELGVYYEGLVVWSSCCLNNLVQLHIESLSFGFRILDVSIPRKLLENLTFPHSLKELRLSGIGLDWGDVGTKIGSLQHLQVLKLYGDAFVGSEWETVEGQFLNLKYLKIAYFHDLKYWRTESCTHFPCLERLCLRNVEKLKEVPSEIGENLKSIKLKYCSKSVVHSVKVMLKEQKDLGNEGLQVEIR